MDKKLQKVYPTYYNLLKVQGLWQAHYQILLIVFQKKFIELNVNTDTLINNMKETCRVKCKYYDCFLQYTNFKDGLIEYQCLCCNKNYQQNSDEKFK